MRLSQVYWHTTIKLSDSRLTETPAEANDHRITGDLVTTPRDGCSLQ